MEFPVAYWAPRGRRLESPAAVPPRLLPRLQLRDDARLSLLLRPPPPPGGASRAPHPAPQPPPARRRSWSHHPPAHTIRSASDADRADSSAAHTCTESAADPPPDTRNPQGAAS